MLFNSLEYLILLASSLSCYWLARSQNMRQIILFIASIIFYMSWSTAFILLLMSIVAINWLIGFKLHQTAKISWLYLAVTANLLMLGFFKYINFFIENLLIIYGLIATNPANTPYLDIILPLGISFYTFEVISYLIDIHRKKTEPEKNFISFSLFVLFFPHLIAGPICRKEQFIPQIKVLKHFNLDHFYKGLLVFLVGFVLKTSIADGIAPYVNVIFAEPIKYSGFDNLMATVGFGIQIFCDFWGYSLMAIGAALLFSIILPANFNTPYLSTSIQDFWRRWHITLSNWLRDYLYISLGGSHGKNKFLTYRNLMLTMLLGGLWHGASWNFIIWGGIHGGALIINRLWQSAPIKSNIKYLFSNNVSSWLLTMITVFIAWIFFRATTVDVSIEMLSLIFLPTQNWTTSHISTDFFELLLLFPLLHWIGYKIEGIKSVSNISSFKLSALVCLLSYLALAYYVDGSDFIYFQF